MSYHTLLALDKEAITLIRGIPTLVVQSPSSGTFFFFWDLVSQQLSPTSAFSNGFFPSTYKCLPHSKKKSSPPLNLFFFLSYYMLFFLSPNAKLFPLSHLLLMGRQSMQYDIHPDHHVAARVTIVLLMA